MRQPSMRIDPLRMLKRRALLFQAPSPTFVRFGALVVVGNILTVLFRVVALRIFTHLMTTNAYGAANLVLGILTLGNQLVVQPVTATQVRYQTAANRAGEGDNFTAQALKWSLVAAALVAAAWLLGVALWPFGTNASIGISLVSAAVFWPILSSCRAVFITRLHAEQRIPIYVWLRVGEGAFIAIVTGLALLVSPGPATLVWGQVGSFAVTILATSFVAPWSILGVLFRLSQRDQGNPRFLENLRRYGAPFPLMSTFQWLANMGDRYVLAALLGTGATGQYLAAFTIASSGFLLANGAMGDLFRPKLFDAETAGDRARASRVFTAWLALYSAISLCGLAAIALLGHWIVLLLLAESYRANAVEIMLWIAFGYSLAGLSLALENRLFSLGRSAKLLWSTALGAGSNVAFAYIFIPWHGVVGAAQASCCSFAVQLLVTALVLRGTLTEHAAKSS
jgi:O-antigen/teichoic acid export membrane protein